MSQTPRSVLQDGSAEVPTSAWGIAPPRAKPRKSTQRRSNEADQRPAPIQSNRHGDSRLRRPERRTGKFLDPSRGQRTRGYIAGTPKRPHYHPARLQARREPIPTRPTVAEVHPKGDPRVESAVGPTCGLSRFPADGFTSCLTISSEYFAAFPHGHCPLSDSRPYLALGGDYLPLWSAISN